MSVVLSPTVQKVTAPPAPEASSKPETGAKVEAKPTNPIEVDPLEGFYEGTMEIDVPKLPEGQTAYKGLKPLKEYVNLLPVEVRQQIKNIQANHSRVQQENASLTKQIKKLEAKLSGEQKVRQADRDQISKTIDHISSTIGDDISEEEIYGSADGLSRFAKREALKAYQESFLPLKERIEAEAKQSMQQEAIQEAQNFISSKPEFKPGSEFNAKVAQLMQEGVSLKAAYLEVKAQMIEDGTIQNVIENANTELSNLNSLKKISSGRSKAPALDTKGMTAHQIFKAIEQYKATYGINPPRRK